MTGHQELNLEHIEAFMRGDERGFQHVYTTFRQRVLTYCVYYMGDPVLAKDAFQEVFIKVYTHRDQLREPKALKGWLLTITRNVCLNMLRASKPTREFVSIDDREPDDPELQQLSTAPANTQLDEDDLRIALAQLPLMYREAFILREFEGYEYTEIAALTGTTVPNVQVRVTRAKIMLREILMPEEEGESYKRKKSLRKSLQHIAKGVKPISQSNSRK